jgi:hypothetical protein
MSKQAKTQGIMLRRKVTTKTNVTHSDMHKQLGVLRFDDVDRVLVEKPEVKRLLGRPGHRLKDIMNQRNRRESTFGSLLHEQHWIFRFHEMQDLHLIALVYFCFPTSEEPLFCTLDLSSEVLASTN